MAEEPEQSLETPQPANASRDGLPPRQTAGPPGRSQFLGRETYRRARLEDAARLIPVLGLFLFVLPITIQSTSAGFGGGTVRWLLFFMGIWLGLIGLAALLSRALRRGGGRH